MGEQPSSSSIGALGTADWSGALHLHAAASGRIRAARMGERAMRRE